MAAPEVVIASAEQLDRLGNIPAGTPDNVYADYMDRIARQADEGGGRCDRKLFELAFFAKVVKPVAYRPTLLPKPVRSSFDLADRLDEAAGRAVAMVISESRPYVNPAAFGIILGSGTDVSPTVQYEIESIGEGEVPEGYRGIVGIDALWTPENEGDEITETNIKTHPIFEIERMCGQVGRTILTECAKTSDMGLFVGQDVIRDNLDTTSCDYEETTKRLAASIAELREAADRLGLPIR